MGVVGYLNVAMFLGCAGVSHPFRGFSAYYPMVQLVLVQVPHSLVATAPGLLIIVVAVILILFPIVMEEGFFEFFGAVNIFICYAATFVGWSRNSVWWITQWG